MAELEAVGDLAGSGMPSRASTLDGLIDAARRLIELHPGLIRLRVAQGDYVIEMDCSPRSRMPDETPEDHPPGGHRKPPSGRHRRAPDVDT